MGARDLRDRFRWFRTLAPSRTFSTRIFEGYRKTYGVGMPIILMFSSPISNKRAVERSLEIQTSRHVGENAPTMAPPPNPLVAALL